MSYVSKSGIGSASSDVDQIAIELWKFWEPEGLDDVPCLNNKPSGGGCKMMHILIWSLAFLLLHALALFVARDNACYSYLPLPQDDRRIVLAAFVVF
ncbi:hypothetical protein LENED_002655 [Lentinula edodes]|uniref:Uncharacterized protein n=1 Tax=Lentinula edodes TaxID=5353 RepID=A0A1Q3E1F7_LENED|nr:hypothetical protein LENED_002655 [Lentinula edodes]